MHALFDDTTPWFWIFVAVATAVIGWAGRWVGMAIADRFRKWVTEPVAEAKQTAQVAAKHTTELKEAVGTPNGAGNLVTMVERSLENQGLMFAWQREQDDRWAADAAWKLEHDSKDDETRETVALIKDHLQL